MDGKRGGIYLSIKKIGSSHSEAIKITIQEFELNIKSFLSISYIIKNFIANPRNLFISSTAMMIENIINTMLTDV